MYTREMMKMKPKSTGVFFPGKETMGRPDVTAALEIRPGGLLVQKRNSDTDHTKVPVPTIKVKVKHGSSYLDVNISSQASFGDLKKMLATPTGMHHEEQKLIFKDKERDSKIFLDVAGVKDGSKIELMEDVISRERRLVESRKNSKMDKASKEIAEICLEVDKFAKEVAKLEMHICSGNRVVEKVLLNLIEDLMAQLIKLDGVVADGDVKLQRKLQVNRVQKYIETLDMLKVRNSTISSGAKMSINPFQKQQEQQRKPFVVTTNWVEFDSGTNNASSKRSGHVMKI